LSNNKCNILPNILLSSKALAAEEGMILMIFFMRTVNSIQNSFQGFYLLHVLYIKQLKIFYIF